MKAEPLVRIAALALSLLGGTGGRRWLVASGLFLGVAAFGYLPARLPDPLSAAAALLVVAAVAAVVHGSTWPPIASHAALSGLALGLPVIFVAAAVLRVERPERVASGALIVTASLSFFAAEGSRANTDAGWRRGGLWAGAVALTAGSAGALTFAAGRLPARRFALLAFALALLAWVPALLSEWLRARRELLEEVKLGLLPEADVRSLAVPWRRLLEKRFGRADERHEYVTSALKLAVARQQQRRRTGEPLRLRQLELLAFRTRIRRTLDARANRYATGTWEELPAETDTAVENDERG